MQRRLSRIVGAVFLIIGLGLFGSCGDDETTAPLPGPIEFTINASSYEDWAYFSMSEGDTVMVSDPETSSAWDLGFQRFRVRVNCGTSGPGSGGAKNMGVMDFESLTEGPSAGYIVDTTLVYVYMDTLEYSGNSEMVDWYNMEGGMPPTIVSKNEIFAIKTADGKYAKAQLLDYYDAEGHSGFITFKYFHQRDGSRNLQP